MTERRADPWRARIEAADWTAITDEVNEYGGALLPQLLTSTEAERIRQLYDEDGLFRSTVTMGRYRFGEGEYRYFRVPYPAPIEGLKQALYPKLLPIARDWWSKLNRPVRWPDTLDDWLRICHDAGQTRSTAILLRYGDGDWNALHRDLYGDLVFPMQVVINLNEPGVDHTGGEFLLLEQRPRRTVPRHVDADSPWTRLCVHHQGSSGSQRARVVGGTGAARCIGGSLGRAAHPRTGVPRRGLSRDEDVHAHRRRWSAVRVRGTGNVGRSPPQQDLWPAGLPFCAQDNRAWRLRAAPGLLRR